MVMINKKTIDKDVETLEDGKILFNFNFVVPTCTSSYDEDRCVEKSDVIIHQARKIEFDEYEEYKYVKYWYKSLTKYLEDFKKYIINRVKFSNSPFFLLNTFTNCINVETLPFSKYKIFKHYSNTKMCKELSLVNNIQISLQKSFKEQGYPIIDEGVLFFSEKSKNIIIDNINLAIKDLKEYIDSVDETKLNKAYYTTNVEYLTDLFNITDPKFIDFIKYELYSVLYNFTNYSDNQNYINLNEEGYTFNDIEDYIDILFDFPVNDAIDLRKLHLSQSIFKICYRKYPSYDAFVKTLIKKLPDTDLTSKDFPYVKQYNYIKSILKHALDDHIKGINILLYGKPGTGKTELTKVLANDLDITAYIVEELNSNKIRYGGEIITSQTTPKDVDFSMLRTVLKNREKTIIVYDEAEDFFRRDRISTLSKTKVNLYLEENTIPVIWTTNSIDCMESSYLRRFTYVCHIEDMPRDIYTKILNKLCKEYHIKLTKELKYVCTENEISIGIVKKALDNYKLTNTNNIDNIIDNIVELQKLQQDEDVKILENENKNLNKLQFDPKLLNTSDDLDEFCKKIKKLKRYDFSLLLYGVSGGGKSFYGEYLAKQLNLKVIKKKASDLESMYVGETEKNIAKIFKDARETKSVLIIDEGDYFISDRNKHYQTWETSRTEEMLQQIENHIYPVIFTTNLMENIDKAAMRRFTYKTKFDYLTREQFDIAWKDFFPKAELPKEVHLSKLCPGDFATVYKRAEFEDYLTDTNKIYRNLELEQNMKKEDEYPEIKI